MRSSKLWTRAVEPGGGWAPKRPCGNVLFTQQGSPGSETTCRHRVEQGDGREAILSESSSVECAKRMSAARIVVTPGDGCSPWEGPPGLWEALKVFCDLGTVTWRVHCENVFSCMGMICACFWI